MDIQPPHSNKEKIAVTSQIGESNLRNFAKDDGDVCRLDLDPLDQEGPVSIAIRRARSVLEFRLNLFQFLDVDGNHHAGFRAHGGTPFH